MSIPDTLQLIPRHKLMQLGLKYADNIHYQLTPEELTETVIRKGQGELNDTGALVINTGKFTGRSPKDKFIVRDHITEHLVNWNEFSIPISEKYFDIIFKKVTNYLGSRKDLWIRDCYACADPDFRVNVRVINEKPANNLFAYNMFLRPREEELEGFIPDWHVFSAPDLKLDPEECGTRQSNAALISFRHRMILIAGSGYTGEMKKGIFTVLNLVLPVERNVLSMHCSANMGVHGDTALFFGLSGTGKTTLSADPSRQLIGDDEHGWHDGGIFNFEGGCYAKCIDLTEEKEPDIYKAIRQGALVENTRFFDGTNTIDFSHAGITENTRVSYPISYIPNALDPSVGQHPKNIFFLTCDAYGVLPPIARLTPEQAMYQFISGYTAKVAGTETGVTEPKATFSACFGAPFLPLHPGRYASMLGEKMKAHKVNVWLVNTGWTGGAYGQGTRMKLAYTRAMISAALDGKLDGVEYERLPVFNFSIPVSCPGVPAELLNPRSTWEDKDAYDNQTKALAGLFIKNFEKYAKDVAKNIHTASPTP
ncbi:MAG TPA: phosphoenolpyruvate carboxykinase (ATP) [Chitinophagaceae bacterium]|nr:phosphoenolpyruvate carboxykinase (ATP) [Chitinophagaceae bacterium]